MIYYLHTSSKSRRCRRSFATPGAVCDALRYAMNKVAPERRAQARFLLTEYDGQTTRDVLTVAWEDGCWRDRGAWA